LRRDRSDTSPIRRTYESLHSFSNRPHAPLLHRPTERPPTDPVTGATALSTPSGSSPARGSHLPPDLWLEPRPHTPFSNPNARRRCRAYLSVRTAPLTSRPPVRAESPTTGAAETPGYVFGVQARATPQQPLDNATPSRRLASNGWQVR